MIPIFTSKKKKKLKSFDCTVNFENVQKTKNFMAKYDYELTRDGINEEKENFENYFLVFSASFQHQKPITSNM